MNPGTRYLDHSTGRTVTLLHVGVGVVIWREGERVREAWPEVVRGWVEAGRWVVGGGAA